MAIGWADLAFSLDEDLAKEAAEAWYWLVPEPWRPLLCSVFGGLFLEKQRGGVFWLECGTGMIEKVADSAQDFEAFMGAERDQRWHETIDEWFLPPLVEQLQEAGKRLLPGQCYGATILPIFEGGAYTVGNMFVVPTREWLTLTASLHFQMKDVPDGGKVEIKVTD